MHPNFHPYKNLKRSTSYLFLLAGQHTLVHLPVRVRTWVPRIGGCRGSDDPVSDGGWGGLDPAACWPIGDDERAPVFAGDPAPLARVVLLRVDLVVHHDGVLLSRLGDHVRLRLPEGAHEAARREPHRVQVVQKVLAQVRRLVPAAREALQGVAPPPAAARRGQRRSTGAGAGTGTHARCTGAHACAGTCTRTGARARASASAHACTVHLRLLLPVRLLPVRLRLRGPRLLLLLLLLLLLRLLLNVLSRK